MLADRFCVNRCQIFVGESDQRLALAGEQLVEDVHHEFRLTHGLRRRGRLLCIARRCF